MGNKKVMQFGCPNASVWSRTGPSSSSLVFLWRDTNANQLTSLMYQHIYNVFKNSSKTNGSFLPLERLLANFMFETPFPPRGRINVKVNLMEEGTGTKMKEVSFKRPAPNKLPLRDFSLIHLFRLLSVENIVLVFSCILNERRVLFVSNRVEDLCIAAETFKSLLFPMIWRHIYVPVVPEPLLERVCAPFPYIMGVTEQAMPDQKLLDGVIQVELHQNKVLQYEGGDEINSLTDKLQARLMKGLKKVVSDTSEPLGPGAIDEKTFRERYESDVEQTFLRFFVKLFRSYKKYVEAPSEEVVEKFKKEEFLAEHPDKCDWLREVMETQMFQCFVDERYEYSNKTDNLEVLFFDEWIDKHDGKQSPFLSDTSQDHRPDSIEVSMVPTSTGLEPNKRYKYLTFPSLDPNLMLPVRKPKRLVTEAEETRDNADRRIDMSRMAMKFFKEKRLYSQHFHSLSLHSRKQNIYFNSLVQYFKDAQAHEEKFAKAQLTLYKSTLGSFKSYATSTSIDDVWAALKSHIRTVAEREIAGVRTVGNQCCQDLYTTAYQMENSIDLLLSEAERLEKKTGRGKNRLESAKALAHQTKGAFKKLRKNLITQNDGSPLLTQNQIARVVAAQCAMDDASLGKLEAATDFRTVLAAYESRMPKIVKTIRHNNIKRIDQFKKSMTEYLKVKRKSLEGALETLTKMEQKVAAIDTKADMQIFTQGTSDFWHGAGGDTTTAAATIGGGPTEGNMGDVDTKSPSISSGSTPLPASLRVSDQGISRTEHKNNINSVSGGGGGGQHMDLMSPPEHMVYDDSSAAEEPPPPISLSPLPSEDHDAPPPPPPPHHTTSAKAPPPPPLHGEPAQHTDAKPLPISTPRIPPPPRTTIPQNNNAAQQQAPPRPPPLPPAISQPTKSPPPLPFKEQTGPPVPPKKRAPMHPTRASASKSFSVESKSSNQEQPPAPPPKVHSRNTSRVTHSHTRARSRTREYGRNRHIGGGSRGGGSHGYSLSVVDIKDYMRSTTTGRTLPTTPMGHKAGGTSNVRLAINSQHVDRRRAYSAAPSPAQSGATGVMTATADQNTFGSFTYVIDLWGSSGFATSLAQATHSKQAIKKLTGMLEEWASIASQVGKKFEATWKGYPIKVPQEGTMQRLWEAMRVSIRRKMDEYLNGSHDGKSAGRGDGLATKLSGLAQGLRMSKGMIKKSMLRYTEARSKLMKEVEEAKSRMEGAEAELKKAEASYAHVCGEQKRTEKEDHASQVTLDRIWQKVDQTKKVKKKREHQLMYYRNELNAITRKHDFVFARMLALYEMKERECQCKLKHTLKFLISQFEMTMQGLKKSILEIHHAAHSLAFKTDLKEFLSEVLVNRSTSIKTATDNLSAYDVGEEPKMSEVLGLKGFDKAIAYANRNIGVIKTIEVSLEAAAESQEIETKLMRKWLSQYARRSSTGVIFSVHDGYTLVPAFNALARCVEEMIKYWQGMHELYGRYESGLHSLRVELKAHVKFQQKQHDAELRSHDIARQERDKAERELKKARQEQDAAIDKHHTAQKAADRGEAVKKNFFKWGKDDVHKLKSKMDQRIKEYNKCMDTLKRKKEALQSATELLEERTRKHLDQMQATEHKRFETVQALAQSFGEESTKRLSHLISVLKDTWRSAESVDLHDNVQRFIKKNRNQEEPPEYVKEDYERSFGYYCHVEPYTPLDIRGMMWF
eukprot:jgi/Bigna1/86240/estExt_fgenesh1_pg.C_90089